MSNTKDEAIQKKLMLGISATCDRRILDYFPYDSLASTFHVVAQQFEELCKQIDKMYYKKLQFIQGNSFISKLNYQTKTLSCVKSKQFTVSTTTSTHQSFIF